MIEGSELLAHKIPPSILTLQDDGTIGVKALDENNTVIFYPIQKVKDTIDGMWVSGLPNEINLMAANRFSGQAPQRTRGADLPHRRPGAF